MNKILLVESEENMVKQALDRFSKAGFEILTANNGNKALQIAKDKLPDLIITDAIVPELSSFELCKAIKQAKDTKSIPIIVLTENHRMEDSFMFLGIKDFLNKPVNMDELENIVRVKLNLTQIMHLQKSKILVFGRPEILACCQQLLKHKPTWSGYYTNNKDTFLECAIKYSPDVLYMDLLLPGSNTDEMIKKIKLIPELQNTVILTYYTSSSISMDEIAIQAQLIEVQYMKTLAQEAGANEYLGAFNPVTFVSLINIYCKDFQP